MKKTLIILMILVTILLSTGIASAHGRPHFSFRLFLPPLAIWAPPPPPVFGYPGYYHPGYYGNRVWVPGYWEDQWTPYGWRRVWVPGYWSYGP